MTDDFDGVVRSLLAQHAPVIVAQIDTDERLVRVDGALLAQTPQWRSFLGQRVTDLLDDPSLVAGIRDALDGREGQTISVMRGRPWLNVARPMRDDKGDVVAAVTLFTYADTVDAINHDLSLGHRLERAAALNEQFRAVAELSRDLVAVCRMDGQLTFLNQAGRDLLGLDVPLEVQDVAARQLFTSSALESDVQPFERAMRAQGSWRGRSTARHQVTGEGIPVAVDAFVVRRHADGRKLGLATVMRDLREQLDTERDMQAKIIEQRALAELSRAALLLPVMDLVKEAVEVLTSRFAPGGASVLRLAPTEDVLEPVMTSWTVDTSRIPLTGSSMSVLAMQENRLVCSDDLQADPRFAGPSSASSLGARSALVCPIAGSQSRPWGFVGIASPEPRHWNEDEQALAEQVAATIAAAVNRDELEGRLTHQALHDPLTGLPNRALVTDRIEHALEVATRRDTRVALLLLDLDDFKSINDTQGHGRGDELLAELAVRFGEVVRAGSTVARLGGDEFVVLCEDLADEEEATFVAESLLDACRSDVVVGDRRVTVTASVGVAVARSGDSTAATLLSDADIAMYRAKRDRPGTYRVFDEAMRGDVLGRVNLAGQLRTAIRAGELEPWFQPIVELASGRIVAFEALARWRDGSGAFVPPDVFIPVAEEIGLIGELGALMLRRSIQEAAGWSDLGEIGVRVNTSAHELRDRTFHDRLVGMLDEAGLPPARLGLEITESVLVEDDNVSQTTLSRLREDGVHLLVDDFGTGYSSLSYLHRFPVVDVLKIDRSFLGEDTKGNAVIEAVVALGRAFGLQVCAEGVETEEQRDLVTELGADLAQGYLLGRPVPAGEVRDVLSGGHLPD